MAQTTGALSWANCQIELSTNGTNWTDVSGFSNSLSLDGGDRQTGEFFTVDGQTPIVTYGKRNMLTVTIQAVYTEEGSDPYAMAQATFAANSALYVRWSPKAWAAIGDFRFYTNEGRVTMPVYPVGAADSPDAIAIEVAVAVSIVTRETRAV